MFADYHVHTYYSDDSETPMEKQVERAVALGLGVVVGNQSRPASPFWGCTGVRKH